MPKDLNAEGVSVVFVDHFDRAVVLGLKECLLLRSRQAAQSMTSGNSDMGVVCRSAPTIGRHGAPRSLAEQSVCGRTHVLGCCTKVLLNFERCKGVDDHVQVTFLGCIRRPLTHNVEADGMLDERPSARTKHNDLR